MPAKTRTILVVSDLQYPYHDAKVWEGALKFARDIQPTGVVVNGDGHDFYDLSKYSKDPKRMNALATELTGFKAEILDPLVRATPKAAGFRHYTEGNHEQRFKKYIWHHAPAISGLKGVTVREALGLDDFGFEYHPERRPLEVGALTIMHGHLIRKHAGQTARAHFDRHGSSLLIGHSHRQGAYFKRNRKGSHGAWEQGCLCDLKPEYEPFPDWQQGWAVVTAFSNGLFNVELVTVIDRKFCVYGGRVFEL